MNNKETILAKITEIQSLFPKELLKQTCLELINETNIDEFFSRTLISFSPVYLPVFERDGDIYAIHIYPGISWEKGAWVRLAHDLEYPYHLVSSFQYLPYVFLQVPINLSDDIDEIWELICGMLDKQADTPRPDKNFIIENIDDY